MKVKKAFALTAAAIAMIAASGATASTHSVTPGYYGNPGYQPPIWAVNGWNIPDDTTTATPDVTNTFTLTGTVAKDCSYYGGPSTSHSIPLGAIGVKNGDTETSSTAFNQASNRDYLSQTMFDSGDLSPGATLAAANMGRGIGGAMGAGGAGQTGGGSDGSVSNPCVTVDSLILMADGTEKPAGQIAIGDAVWTRHERTGELGAFKVTAAYFAKADVMQRPGWPDASAEHRFSICEASPLKWFPMKGFGAPKGEGMVAKITVEEAHTYLARHPSSPEWRLCHNVKPAM